VGWGCSLEEQVHSTVCEGVQRRMQGSEELQSNIDVDDNSLKGKGQYSTVTRRGLSG
jgi:hypothetical protein